MEGGRGARDDGRRTAGTQFACFTSTKVHILTQKVPQPVTLGHWLAAAAVFVSMVNIGGGFVMTSRMLGIKKYLLYWYKSTCGLEEHEARNCEIAARYSVYLLYWYFTGQMHTY